MQSTKERVSKLVDQGLTVREIASILNVSTQAIYKHLKALDKPPPSVRGDREPVA